MVVAWRPCSLDPLSVHSLLPECGCHVLPASCSDHQVFPSGCNVFPAMMAFPHCEPKPTPPPLNLSVRCSVAAMRKEPNRCGCHHGLRRDPGCTPSAEGRESDPRLTDSAQWQRIKGGHLLRQPPSASTQGRTSGHSARRQTDTRARSAKLVCLMCVVFLSPA